MHTYTYQHIKVILDHLALELQWPFLVKKEMSDFFIDLYFVCKNSDKLEFELWQKLSFILRVAWYCAIFYCTLKQDLRHAVWAGLGYWLYNSSTAITSVHFLLTSMKKHLFIIDLQFFLFSKPWCCFMYISKTN